MKSVYREIFCLLDIGREINMPEAEGEVECPECGHIFTAIVEFDLSDYADDYDYYD